MYALLQYTITVLWGGGEEERMMGWPVCVETFSCKIRAKHDGIIDVGPEYAKHILQNIRKQQGQV